MRDTNPVVGQCAVCLGPVRRSQARRIKDQAVSKLVERPVRRLAHAGDCAQELYGRIGTIRTEGR